jgi:hypothetical protein
VLSRRNVKLALLVALAALGGGVFGVSEYLSKKVAETSGTCIGAEGAGDRCRFSGGPLAMSGAPVFLDGFQQAFLPTSQKIDFVDATGQLWTAPPQTLTDGATIPPLFAPLMGDRQSLEFLMAAALHDAYCGVGNNDLETFQTRPWEDVHRMFFEALIVGGTPPQKAKIMFAAVYLGGPRWNDPDRSLEGVSEEDILREMEWCLRWIEENDPSADEIVTWMRDREMALLSGDQEKLGYEGDPRGI